MHKNSFVYYIESVIINKTQVDIVLLLCYTKIVEAAFGCLSFFTKREGSMKIWTLMENTACRDDLCAEHGLSLYIETGETKILFDMGQSPAFAQNAEKLGVDLRQVDFAVLSHGHYDHGGGLETFLKINKTAPVYVSPLAFGDYYNASGKYIGLNQKLRHCDRLQMVERDTPIAQGVTLLTGKNRKPITPIHSSGLQKWEGGRRIPDDFQHEQYLLIEEQGKKICFSGCSHRGIRNIRHWIPCDILIGGFHFRNLEPKGETVTRTAELLAKSQTTYYTCHCTGLLQYASMKAILGDRLQNLSTGTYLEL